MIASDVLHDQHIHHSSSRHQDSPHSGSPLSQLRKAWAQLWPKIGPLLCHRKRGCFNRCTGLPFTVLTHTEYAVNLHSLSTSRKMFRSFPEHLSGKIGEQDEFHQSSRYVFMFPPISTSKRRCKIVGRYICNVISLHPACIQILCHVLHFTRV